MTHDVYLFLSFSIQVILIIKKKKKKLWKLKILNKTYPQFKNLNVNFTHMFIYS